MKMTIALPLLCGLWLALPVCAGQTYFNSSGGQLNVGWQDKDGKAQQLTYRLEAGKLPPLIAKINREKRNSKNYVLFLGSTDAETNQAPCLSLVQFQIENGELVVSAYQRSSDANLGLPAE